MLGDKSGMDALVSLPLLAGLLEDLSVQAAFWPIGRDLRRLRDLVRREGPVAAWRKGVRYLKWKVPAEALRLRMLWLPRVEDRFTLIYRTNLWAAAESVSGPAASLENTAALRRDLPALFDRLGVRSLFDAPCGDFYWMQHVVRGRDLDYVGGDIVRPMIEQNNARHGGPRCRFVHLDVSRDAVPRTDLWLCRGLFSLLSNADSRAVLEQFVRSGTPYILLSSHRVFDGPANENVASGDFRYVDMRAAPFNLPAPLETLQDRYDEDLCLWSREQVEAALRAA